MKTDWPELIALIFLAAGSMIVGLWLGYALALKGCTLRGVASHPLLSRTVVCWEIK